MGVGTDLPSYFKQKAQSPVVILRSLMLSKNNFLLSR